MYIVLVASSIAIKFNYDFSEVHYVLLALLNAHCFPKSLDTFYQLGLCFWFCFPSYSFSSHL